MRLEPVDFDPFAKKEPVLEPVDFDPFKGQNDPTKNPTQNLAPASGAFPAVPASPRAVLPSDASLPQGQIAAEPAPAIHAPPPSDTPVPVNGEPGLLEESYGDMVKGLHSTKRGAFITGFMTGMYDDVDNIAKHLAASKDIEAAYPASGASKKASEELETLKDTGTAGFLPALGVYANNPRLAVSQTIQSLPGMLSSLVTVPVGAVAGSVVGPAGAGAGAFLGLGVGSAATDFGNAFEEYASDKWKPKSAEEWKAILSDPEKYSEAGTYAAKHAGMVGLFDMVGGKLAGKFGGALATRAGVTGSVARIPASMVGGAPVSAAAGGAGEAAGGLWGKGEFDPAAVAGEIAGGVVGDVAAGGIEATVKATNIGGAKETPATPEAIRGATEAIQGQQPPVIPVPEEVAGSIIVGDATPMFYSPLRKYIEEKAPGAADRGQWVNTLNNAPGVKQEELADTGLDLFLAEAGGKVTKKQVLDFLDENAIRLEETQRQNEGPQTTRSDNWISDPFRDAKYQDYTLPGERQGYTELTLHLPTRNVEGDNTQRDFVGEHYTEPNVVGHARVTDRVDQNGMPFALIEEIQSDWHQAGRKFGYGEANLKFLDDVDARILAKIDAVGNSGTPLARAYFTDNNTDQTLNLAVQEGIITQAEAQHYKIEVKKSMGSTVNGPFKSSWDELAFKRMLRWAADKGYRRVAWVNAAEQSRRYPGDAKRDMGMQQFYDKIIPSIAKKWAKRLGGTYGQTSVEAQFTYDVLDVNGEVYYRGAKDEDAAKIMAQNIGGTVQPRREGGTVQYIDIPQAGVEMIQRGLPMYSELGDTSKRPRGPRKTGATLDDLAGPTEQTFAREFMPALDELAKRFGLSKPVKLFMHPGYIVVKDPRTGRNKTVGNALGMARPWGREFEIHISLQQHKTAAEVWATIAHELGHHIMIDKYENAPTTTKVAIRAAYDEWKASVPHNENMQKLIARRDNAVVAFHSTRMIRPNSTLMDMGGPQQRQYWVSFEEWFAEQTARWATSSIKPLTTVEKFFKGLGKLIVDALEGAYQKFGLPFTAHKAVSDWLDSFHTDAAPFAQDVNVQTTVETTKENAPHMAPEDKPVEKQPETVAVREGLDELFKGRPPGEVKVAAAYADKFNKIYKWALGIHQVAARNPGIQPLQEYVETIAVAQLTKQQVMIRAQEVIKAWNKLGQRQSDALAAFIDDVENMVYLTPDEVTNGVARYPTQAEVADLAKKHGVTTEGLGVFKMVAETFNEHLTRLEAMLNKEAAKIVDPKARNEAIAANAKYIANLRSKPYFPAMRFGDYTVTVRDAAGKVIHFETFEKERRAKFAAEAIQKKYNVSKDRIQIGKLDPTVRPLLGVPTPLLERMAEKLQLNRKQRDALEQLKFELAPAQSFRHHFQHKQRIAGYSMDFRRAYANYFFHGANHLVKAMYADDLRGLIKATKEETSKQYDAVTRHEIVAYMNDHVENWLDPKPDWHAVRAIAFMWSLAFSPAAAAANLTQTLMTTFPFLAQNFGDLQAMKTMMQVGADFQTYYKTGRLQNSTEFELKAISRAIADGIVNEQMAAELAGFAEGRTLGLGMGGNEVQRGLTWFLEKGAFMFQMAEQINRRLSFRAALKLTLANPNTKYAKAMVTKHKLQYEQLRREGWTESEAQAYVAAVDTVKETQFQYGKEYAPRMMRGRIRAVLVFKTFVQSYVVFLANYPQAAVRSLLIMGFMGGLMGVPGAEDLKELLKAIGWQMFGKQFDLEKEARRWVIQLLGNDENGRQWADTILQGISRQGFGIPGMMDMLGGTVGVDVPMPTFDRSKAISSGTILPVELGKLFGPPTLDQDKAIADTAQKASGAVFGAGFNIYKALTNSKISATDTKRWERAVPRAMGSVMKAFRVGTEGRERTSTGATLVKYDVRDTEQLMEVMGIAAGYTPYRQALQWDRIIAGQEVVKLWDVRRTGLMKQMGNAVLGQDQKEIERVREAIRTFNSSLPPEARGKAISSDALRQSVGTQARTRAAQEAEMSVKKSDIPILQEVQKLYPQSQATSVRRVRGTP